MEITSTMALPISVPTPGGPPKIVQIKPGKHLYKIDYKDPVIAEQLRIYRKHRRIQFQELLPSDVAVLKNLKGTPEEKQKELKAAAGLKPTPVRRVVKGVPNAKRPPKALGTDKGTGPKKS